MSLPDQDQLRDILALACRAPSVHNTQPWRWVVRDEALHLYADTRRQLTYADSSGRDLLISCGAVLHELRVAAAAAGQAAGVNRLPDDSDKTHLAAVTFATRPATADAVKLAEAIGRRRTDRRQVSSWPVPSGVMESLVETAGRRDGVMTAILNREAHPIVQKAIDDAMRLQHRNDAYLDELHAWSEVTADAGLPITNRLTREAAVKEPGSFTRFSSGLLSDDHEELEDPAAEWLLLSTRWDDVLSWLQVGEALDSMWLDATVTGLSLVPYTQPIEVPSARRLLQTQLLAGGSFPQLVVRIGWPPVSNEPLTATPRRPVDEILELG